MYLPKCTTESITQKAQLFDGTDGDCDLLIYDQSHDQWQWNKSATKPEQGFAYRNYTDNFILSLQIEADLLSESASLANGLIYGLKMKLAGEVIQLGFDIQRKLRLFQNNKILCSLSNCRDFNVFQIEKKENSYIFSAAIFGQPFQVIQSINIEQDKETIAIGIFNAGAQLILTNIRYSVPAWKNLVPYQEYLGSRLELLNPKTGKRKIIFQTYAGIEAPNWTQDGKNILINSAGRIFNFNLTTESVSCLDTGFAIKNNNDHVLSADGKWLGISHHAQNHHGQSIVYKLPADGGEPQALTLHAPSYLHGWSPDGRYVIYTALRNGQWDIYRVPTDGSGDEIQLTNNSALDDGSEYSRDGEYIYFNSTRTGTMQIWRMRADGSEQEQITFDEFNDWFPHLSPDGKTLVFLSYQPSMQADQHPYYQQVYLRSVDLEKVLELKENYRPKVLAYLYGGQGTINVPSWSPDGQVIAFVSHTQLRE